MKIYRAAVLMAALPALSLTAQQTRLGVLPRAQIMIVGVAHLVAQADLHNATWREGALSPHMQAQIEAVVHRLGAFRPTKVMVEADATNRVFAERYKGYLTGSYELGANEVYQFGFRLAAQAHNATIYPIDTHGSFPFEYDSVKASAVLHGQTAILDAADAYTKPFRDREHALEARGALLDVIRYVNSPTTLDGAAAWYAFVDRIGDANDDAGAKLVSYWYARNLHMFANIMHAVAPGDRVIVLVGASHAAQLRPLVTLSADLRLIDPEPYMR